jgi:hypothetical protein
MMTDKPTTAADVVARMCANIKSAGITAREASAKMDAFGKAWTASIAKGHR